MSAAARAYVNLQDSTLHFRCEFSVQSIEEKLNVWAAIFDLIRKWMIGKNQTLRSELRKPWFENGGAWSLQNNRRFLIATENASMTQTGERYWAVRYEHPNLSADGLGSEFRQWRTDLALSEAEPGVVVVSLQTLYFMTPGYMGDDPPDPTPNSPRLIRDLVTLPGLAASSGSQPMLSQPIGLKDGDGCQLIERIIDPGRKCPLVYLSRHYQTGNLSMDPVSVARNLCGVAAVYYAESSALDKETGAALPPHLRCWNGKIRVYLPNVHQESESDGRRHRYFTPEQVQDLGAEGIGRIIARSLGRRVSFLSSAPVSSIEGVRLRRSQHDLAVLRSAVSAAPSKEVISKLTEVNGALEQGLIAAKQESDQLRGRVEDLEYSVLEKEEEIANAQYAVGNERDQAAAARKERDELRKRLEVFHSLRDLPTSITDCCRMMRGLLAGRVEFTEKALEDSEDADYPRLPEVWKALWELGDTFHRLVFESSGVDLEKEFKERTGFDLAMTEGRTTKNAPKLMKQRVCRFKGIDLDTTPHLKLQTGNKYFRVYFGIYHPEQLIVINRVGDHLDTASTRKRK